MEKTKILMSIISKSKTSLNKAFKFNHIKNKAKDIYKFKHKMNHFKQIYYVQRRTFFHNFRNRRFSEPLFDIKEGLFMQKLKEGKYNWVFGHLSFALSAASFFSDDLLNLRIAAIFASFNAILFNRFWIKPPLILAINYHMCFIAINSYHVARYFYLQHFYKFSDEQKLLFDEIYSKAMTIQQFHSLIQCSEFRDYNKDELIIGQDQRLRYIYHIVHGRCSFIRKNADNELEFFFYMKKNFFIGELAFLQQEGTQVHQIGTVKAREPTRVLAINIKKLKKLISKQEPNLGPAFLSLLTHDLIDRFAS
eukprot:TRINITY_DN5832_c0_g2_i1.p1 TRINITY_DN5832_c0_g2~~TRINITY_DN5832_c0_g2_i1.p1  ORF type:complete len:307 (-),score=64.51 TRINITY_DN5832_c0_g2_i1:118-1038(-)